MVLLVVIARFMKNEKITVVGFIRPFYRSKMGGFYY